MTASLHEPVWDSGGGHWVWRADVAGGSVEAALTAGCGLTPGDGEWRRDVLSDRLFAANLRDGESPVQWWWREIGRPSKAWHRVMMAPFVFPDRVSAVGTWSWIGPDGDAPAPVAPAVVAVAGVDAAGTAFLEVEHAEQGSLNASRNRAAVQAGALVGRLVGPPEPLS